MRIYHTVLALMLSMALIQCSSGTTASLENIKIHPNDPFKSTITPSQYFDIDANQDQIVEGTHGTVVVCPKGCFKHANGNIVEGPVKIELAEALTLEDMILSNMTTTADGHVLQTDGMIYFNATANGHELTINKDIPIHVEIPTEARVPGMMLYHGTRDENGNMNWIEPVPLENYLLTVDIHSLDFLPQGFHAEVEKGMPYKKYQQATQAVTDSLYYSLSVSDGSELTAGNGRVSHDADGHVIPVSWKCSKVKITETEYDIVIKANIEKGWKLYEKNEFEKGPQTLNIEFEKNNSYELVGELRYREPEVHHDPIFGTKVSSFSKEVVFMQRIKVLDKKARTKVNIEYMESDDDSVFFPMPVVFSLSYDEKCGIDPAIIQVIKSDAYQHTFIATREFEKRLKVIFKTCRNEVLEAYVNNLDKNMWEVDSLVAEMLGESPYRKEFVNFSNQRLTKVKEAEKSAGLLKDYYARRLKEVKTALEEAKVKLKNELKANNDSARKAVVNYQNLLKKREQYRREAYGIELRSTGWKNIDLYLGLSQPAADVSRQIRVDNGHEFDRVYTYMLFTSVKSLHSLSTTNKIDFEINNKEVDLILGSQKGSGVLVAIGYKGENASMAIFDFTLGQSISCNLVLSPTTKEEFQKRLEPYDSYSTENSITDDLAFMRKFYMEEQRQLALVREAKFIRGLWNIAFPCCAEEYFREYGTIK